MKKASSSSEQVRVVLDETSRASRSSARALRDSVASDLKVLRKFAHGQQIATPKVTKQK